MWRDETYLLDILILARKVRERTSGLSWEAFRDSDEKQDAVVLLIQRLGEAARRVSEDYRAAHPELPWAEMIGMRHRLVHDYKEINPALVWEVVQRDIPALIAVVEPLVPPDEEGERS